MFSGVTTSLVILVGGPLGGNQNSFRPSCPIRGLSACGGNSTQSSVKSARTPSASPFNQASSYLLCTCLIFATSSADNPLPAALAPDATSKNTATATALRMLIKPPATHCLSRLDAFRLLPSSSNHECLPVRPG